MGSTPPLALLVTLAVLTFISRPLLEARRLSASMFLVLGAVLGPAVTGVLTAEVLHDLEPLLALSAGWLVLLAAESWDLDQMRGTGAVGKLVMIGAACMLVAGLSFMWPAVFASLSGGMDITAFLAPALLLACVTGAIDSESVRTAVLSSSRPDTVARRAPMYAAISLGGALLFTALAAGAQTSAALGDQGVSWVGPMHFGATLTLGLALGLFYIGPIRLAQGRGALLALLVSLPFTGWGIARWMSMSPLALLFAAGIVLANDRTRRDMIFTLLREYQRIFTVIVLLVSGARLPVAAQLGAAIGFWLMTATFSLGRPVLWRLAPGTGLRTEQILSMSPLAIVMALETLHWPGVHVLPVELLPVMAAVGFVVGDAAWGFLWRQRHREAQA